MIILTWLPSSFFTLYEIVSIMTGDASITFNVSVGRCSFNLETESIVKLFVCNLIPFLFISTMYLYIVIKVRSSSKLKPKLSNTTRAVRDHKILYMSLLIVVSAIITWLPNTIMYYFVDIANHQTLNYLTYLWCYISATLNPIIYLLGVGRALKKVKNDNQTKKNRKMSVMIV